MGTYEPGRPPARMVPRYPEEHDRDEAALDPTLNEPTPDEAALAALDACLAQVRPVPPHILRHEGVKDGLDRLIHIDNTDRHPPFSTEFDPMLEFPTPLPKPGYDPYIRMIGEEEYRTLRQEASDAKVLRAELERITAELHQLRGTHDKLLIQYERVNRDLANVSADRHSDLDSLERAERALNAIYHKEVPEGHSIMFGLMGVIHYLSQIAAYGLGMPDAEVNLDEEDE